MCMLFSYLTRKYKVIRKKVHFALQLTNYLFITTRNVDIPVKSNDVQLPEQFSARYINLSSIIVFTTGRIKFSILSKMYPIPIPPTLYFRWF